MADLLLGVLNRRKRICKVCKLISRADRRRWKDIFLSCIFRLRILPTGRRRTGICRTGKYESDGMRHCMFLIGGLISEGLLTGTTWARGSGFVGGVTFSSEAFWILTDAWTKGAVSGEEGCREIKRRS